MKADLELASRRISSWSLDVFKALQWLPVNVQEGYRRSIIDRQPVNVSNISEKWLERCSSYVLQMCEGEVRDPAVQHRKLVTYHNWCAEDDRCDFDKPAFYLRSDIGSEKIVAMARFRLSSHRLRVETGRFAHVDYINRVCQDPHCINVREVQDEQHAVFRCSMCDDLRREHASLFHNADGENMRRFWQGNVNDVSTFVRRCLILYESAYRNDTDAEA
jgi:hypothetical protein